jgi:choline-sulfatase
MEGLTRKQLLQSGAAAGSALLLGSQAAAAAARHTHDLDGMNVVLFITDQERAIQHFPKQWATKHLPGMTRLKRHGLSFERAFTNSCMCSPARATLLTGYHPAQHGVKYTLEEDMPAEEGYPQVELPVDFENVATVMGAAGYEVVYKGKWHLSKPAGPHFVPADIAKYGFSRWNPPDAGANQDISQTGGGFADHDDRYMNGVGNPATGEEGVLQYLSSAATRKQPFFLVISLVNPHDVLQYPNTLRKAGYGYSWLEGDIRLPATVDEDLSTKPAVQKQLLRLLAKGMGALDTPRKKRAYLNFYANLIRAQDRYLVAVLDKLTETGLLDDTLVIRTADHGEMGMAHGGLRQKNFNFYEETMRVPLVYSNPRLFPKPVKSKALVSHVDFLPTLANLFRAPRGVRADWKGVDYSHLVLHPSCACSEQVQSQVVFTFDDYQSGQASPPYPDPPNHIVSIRERRWKLAKYYDPDGNAEPEWEMYDLANDPLEQVNLAHKSHRRTREQEQQFRRLRCKLTWARRTRLRPAAD